MSTTVERLDATKALDLIIRPRSVVVIGANDADGSMTGAPLRNLARHGFRGQITVVNPRRTEVLGVPSYPSPRDIPEAPDTAILVLGSAKVPAALRECADRGIRTATVIAAGFDEGAAALQGRGAGTLLREVLDTTGIRILGPNTAGLLNLADSYVPRASVNHPASLVAGKVALVTQSGGLCNILLNRAAANGVGIGIAMATGNQLDLDLWDVSEYLLDDPNTDVLLVVVEGIKSPARFVDVAVRARTIGKPLVVMKLGSSEAGRRMVETHSGALAGSAEVQRTVMSELGIIQVDDLDELWEVASLVTAWGAPTRQVDRLGVISLSGGDAAILLDAASELGIHLPPPSDVVVQRMEAEFPGVHISNPFDSQAATAVTPKAAWPRQVAIMAADPAYDATLLALPVLATPDTVPVIAPHLTGLSDSGCTRLAVSMWTAGDATEPASEVLRTSGLPVFATSVRAARALHLYSQYGQRQSVPIPGSLLTQISEQPATAVAGGPSPYWTSRSEIAAWGVPTNVAALVHTVDDAVRAAEQIGYPVTVKLSYAAVTHKAAAGGVFLQRRTAAEVREAAEKLMDRGLTFVEGEGVVVEEHVNGVLMAFIGAHRDEEFGPIIMAGLGGGFAEHYRDIARATCPVDGARLQRMVRSTTFGRMLSSNEAAVTAYTDLIARLSRALVEDRSLVSFDVNPLIVRADGSLVAVDARTAHSLSPEVS
jgi:acetate---CoA ligase (ADP-forming)